MASLAFLAFVTSIAQATAFKWGTATASYQIEGAANVDGRLPSIWDTFSAIPNKVHRNNTGEVADDNYYRFHEDIQLMKDLNIAHYRLSFAWPRIIPDGKTINQAGINHYNKVIDALLDAGIEPFVTLYHWDLPQSIYDITKGGWINDSIVPYFEFYAKTVLDNFNDRVKHWLTFNEPWTFCVVGYNYGIHAPGRCTDCEPFGGNTSIEAYQCAHNVLLSHAAAVKYFRAQQYDQQGGEIGMTLNVDWAQAASSKQEDYEAAQRRLIWECGWFADPIYFGDYPQIMKDYIGARLPQFTETQKRDLNGSNDFFGLNHYTTKWIVAQAKDSAAEGSWNTDQANSDSACNQYNSTPIGIQADSDWLWSVPSGIYHVVRWIDERYANPTIYITENGCDVPNEDNLSLQDVINDAFRIKYYDGYITAMTKAKEEGTNIGGYYAWSLLDNFEWADGYSKRFGLHYVNYTNNLTRTAKQSAKWFANYINDFNPRAEYKGPTLSPTGIPSDYAHDVCGQEIDNGHTVNNVAIIVCFGIVAIAVLLVMCIICVQKMKKMNAEILTAEQLASGDGNSNDEEDETLKQAMLKNVDKGNVGDMYKRIDLETP